jgi:hypothetical protein
MRPVYSRRPNKLQLTTERTSKMNICNFLKVLGGVASVTTIESTAKQQNGDYKSKGLFPSAGMEDAAEAIINIKPTDTL